MLIKNKDIEQRIFDVLPDAIDDQVTDRTVVARLLESIAIVHSSNDPVVIAETIASAIVLSRAFVARKIQADPDLIDLVVEFINEGGDRRLLSRPDAHRRNRKVHLDYKMAEGGTCRVSLMQIYAPLKLASKV